MKHPETLTNLSIELAKLPGIGPKIAQRLAFHVVEMPTADVERLVTSLRGAREDLHECPRCHDLTQRDQNDGICARCSDPQRDQTRICVVEEPGDVVAIDRTDSYEGLFHVLHGTFAPMEGRGTDAIRLASLRPRLHAGMEVIIATSTTTEGEATAQLVQRIAEPLVDSVTRLARGLATGQNLNQIDELTLGQAIAGRIRLN